MLAPPFDRSASSSPEAADAPAPRASAPCETPLPSITSACARTGPFTAPPVDSWLAGHLRPFVADKLGFLTRAAREHGDVVPLRMGPQRMWVVSDPDLIGEVFVGQVDAFRKDIGLRRVKVVLGDGLLSTEGAEHARRSKLAQPAFRKQELDRFAGDMVAITSERAARWAGRGTVELDEELSRLALTIVARSLFGAALDDEAAVGRALTEVLRLLETRLHALLPLPLWIPTPHNRRFRAALGVLDRAVMDIVRQRRAARAEGRADLLSRLMGATAEGARPLSDKELRDEVMTLVLAGHETTANALAFALSLLSRHPDVAARLRAEVDQVCGGRAATADDVPRLELAGQVFQEALRLYPPAWIIGREAARDVDLGGRVPVKKGHMVAAAPWVVHRDPRWWGPDAAEFRPERFARGAPRPRPHAYFPFGIGKRACIGRSFAMLEGTLVLATLAQQVDLEVTGEPALQPQLTLRPGPLGARVRAR
jgi:cytochrome P450